MCCPTPPTQIHRYHKRGCPRPYPSLVPTNCSRSIGRCNWPKHRPLSRIDLPHIARCPTLPALSPDRPFPTLRLTNCSRSIGQCNWPKHHPPSRIGHRHTTCCQTLLVRPPRCSYLSLVPTN